MWEVGLMQHEVMANWTTKHRDTCKANTPELHLMAGTTPPPEASADSTAATGKLQERLTIAEAEAAASAQLRESLAVAEAEAAQLRARLDAATAEADSTAAQLRQDAARSDAAQSELAEQLALATSTREVTLTLDLVQYQLGTGLPLDAAQLSVLAMLKLAHQRDSGRSKLNLSVRLGLQQENIRLGMLLPMWQSACHIRRGLTTNLPATQALQAELEARSAALAAAQANSVAAGEAAAEAERLKAQLERLGAERDDLAAALDGMQQVLTDSPL